MFKVVFLVVRKSDSSVEQYREYSNETHVPLVEKIPGLVRYVVNYSEADDDGTPPPYDGLIELWFANSASFAAAMASEAGRTAVADQAAFLDTERTLMMVVKEIVVID